MKNQSEEISSLENDENLNLETPEEDRKIVWQGKDYSIREFSSMELEGELVLQPEYQRKYVMDVTKASKLIESILMDVPIPVIYLAEEPDETYSVIDGQQRLTTFLSFIKGTFPDGKKFSLRGLKVLTKLKGKSYDDLEKPLQLKIKKTTIHTIVIKKESEEDIKFEIFERLNTGSIKLNQDELRNSVYRGKYIKLLAELEENAVLHQLINNDNAKKRMLYRGFLLRFFGLSDKSYINYKPSMKQFLNKELRDNRNISDEKAQEYRKRLAHCLDLCKTVFGEHAFRKYSVLDGNDVHGRWANPINVALMEVQMCGFQHYSKANIVPKSDEIRNAMIDLLLEQQFNETISVRTNDKSHLVYRHKTWYERLADIVGDIGNQSRTFSMQLRKAMYEESATCAICEQEIHMLDDAELDHIIPFSKGGSTTKDNAQLTHRYCNRSKSNKVTNA